MRFRNQQFVRWDDIDAFGHVNNAKYLTYVQEARFNWSWFQFKEANETPSLVEMVVARAEVDYVQPIYDGGEFVDVDLWVTRIGTSSFDMEYEISSKGKVYAKVKTVQVAVSLETKKSRPITDAEKDFLNQYLDS